MLGSARRGSHHPVTPIWERVLQRSVVGPDDNFIDLGGNPELAIKLANEIAKVCGQDVSAEMICLAPTIAALSALLEQPSLPRFSTLIELTPGTEEPPVFFVHGLDGGGMKLAQLARSISSRHRVYGIQARGFDGGKAMDRVEDMVPPYLDAITKRQQLGPYFLIGYSLGGMVALEIARQLIASGQTVALLVMLESYPHLRHLSPGQRIRVVARRVNRHLLEMKGMSPLAALDYVARRWKNRSRISRMPYEAAESSTLSFSSAASVQRVRDAATVALGCYRPRYYPGKIRFVRSEIGSYFPKDPAAIWANLAEGLECETVPGDHLSMLSDHFEDVAGVLSRYLREAFSDNKINP